MKKNIDIRKKNNSLKATSDQIAQYILDRIKGGNTQVDELYVPYIDEDLSELKGLDYRNSIMFLCKSTINVNSSIDELKDMLVMIFPFAQVNDDNNDIISGFKLVYSTNSDINYADITLQNDTILELELDDNNKIKIKIVSNELIVNTNDNDVLKINFNIDTFYEVFTNNMYEWNEITRNEYFNKLNGKYIYNKDNFIEDGKNYDFNTDYFLFNYDLDDTLPNSNYEFHTLVNYNNTTVRSFVKIKDYSESEIKIYETVLNVYTPLFNSRYKHSNYQIFNKETKEINDKTYIYIPYCSGLLNFDVPIYVKTYENVAGFDPNYSDLKIKLENLYYLNFTDVLCMTLDKQEFINNSNSNITQILYYSENDNYYVYKTSKKLNDLFSAYNKFDKVTYDDLVINNNYIPVFYYKCQDNDDSNYENLVIVLFKDNSIIRRCIKVDENNTIVNIENINKNISSIKINIQSDTLQYKDPNNVDYLLIDKINEKILFQYDDISDVNHFYYSLTNPKEDENIAISLDDTKKIKVDLELLCLLKTPKLSIADIPDEIYISVTEYNKYIADDLDGLYLTNYSIDAINPDITDKYNIYNVNDEKATSSITISNIIDAIDSKKDYEFLIHFTLDKIPHDYYNQESQNTIGYLVIYVKNISNSIAIKFSNNDRSIVNLSLECSKDGQHDVITISDSLDNILIKIYDSYVKIPVESIINDYFPCDCKTSETDNEENYYNNDVFSFMALYKDETPIEEEDNTHFTIFIGNDSIRLNDTTEESNKVYEDFTEEVESTINSIIERVNSIKYYSIKKCYDNPSKIYYVFVSIFIEYEYKYKDISKSVSHYFKRLVIYQPANTLTLTKLNIVNIILKNEENNFVYSRYATAIEDFIKLDYEAGFYTMDINNTVLFTVEETKTEEPIIIENKNVDANESDINSFFNYLSNDGCNQYSVRCFNGENYINVPLEYTEKQQELESIVIKKAILQCYPYGEK